MIPNLPKDQLKLIQYAIAKLEKVAHAKPKYNQNQLVNAIVNQTVNVNQIQLAHAKEEQIVTAKLKLNQNQKQIANAALNANVKLNHVLNVNVKQVVIVKLNLNAIANVNHVQRENVKAVQIVKAIHALMENAIAMLKLRPLENAIVNLRLIQLVSVVQNVHAKLHQKQIANVNHVQLKIAPAKEIQQPMPKFHLHQILSAIAVAKKNAHILTLLCKLQFDTNLLTTLS